MKKLLTGFWMPVLMMAILVSCKKDENKIYYEGGTEPVLVASVSNSIPLSFATADQQAVSLTWTNPDYNFSTGVSSQDVTYTIEMDTLGANFTNPGRVSVVVSKELSRSFLQSEINDLLLNTMQLSPGTPHTLQVRVTSSLVNSTAKLYSNILQFTVTPYAIPPKVDPPASGNLYITGSATPASWMGGGDPENVAQKFTKLSNTLFELTVNLSAGNSYLFVPVYGDWGNKYGYIGSNNGNNVNGDDFKKEGGDMLSPAIAGPYKITVDFQRGKFTVVKQ